MAMAENTVALQLAIQQKLITMRIHGAVADTSYHGDYSSHYGPCMAIDLVANTTQPISVQLDYGYKLEPADTTLQTMMVTQALFVKLPPKQPKTYRVFAMCTQAHDGGPSADAVFTIGKRTNGNLLALAELINRKKYQCGAAQNALWCLTDNYDITSVYSEDTAMMYDLRRFVAKAKGLSNNAVYHVSENNASTPITYITQTIYSGSISYSCSHTTKVFIALFDENNKMKRVYVNNEVQREGIYTYKYEISNSETEDKKHYLRLFRDGKLEDEIAILPQ